jgi:hypothetical protein
MENSHKTPITKTNALAALGVHTKKANRRLSPKVELVHVKANRRVLKQGDFATSVIVVLSGSITLQDTIGNTRTFNGPLAIDFWAADERRISILEATTTTESTLLLIDWTHRDVVLTALPRVRRLSSDTQRWFETVAVDTTTTDRRTPQPTRTDAMLVA